MRTLPSNMTDMINDRYGQNFIYFVEIFWNDTGIVYSTEEGVINSKNVYKYIKNISGLENISRLDGFGSTSNITVVFNDSFGHFKDKYDNDNIYMKPVNIYVGSIENDCLLKIFQGSIVDEPSYNIDTFEFTVIIESIDKNKTICYTPNITDISDGDPNHRFFELYLEGKAWPEIFGEVKNVPLAPLVKNIEFEVAEDLEYEGEIEYFLKINPEAFDAEVVPLNVDMRIMLFGRGNQPFFFYIDGHFEYRSGTYGFVFFNADIDVNIYEDLTITTTPAENFLRDGTLVIDLVEQGPWLENLYVQLQDEAPEQTFGISKFVTKIVKQENLHCITNYDFVTNQHYMAPADAVTYAPNFTKIIWARMQYNQAIRNIPKGSFIAIKDWGEATKPLQNIYIFDSKNNTTPVEFLVPGEEKNELIPSGMYTVKYTSGDDSNRFWSNGHPECSYIQFEPDIYIRYFNSGQVKNVMYGNLISSIDTDVAIVEYMIDKYLGFGAVEYSGSLMPANCAILQEEDITTIIPELLWQKGKVLRESFTESDEYLITIIDLYNISEDDYPSVMTFNGSNIHGEDAKLTYSSTDEIITVMSIVYQDKDYLKEPRTLTKKRNKDIYGDKRRDVDYYMYDNITTDMSILDMWLERNSDSYLIIEFTTYFDAIAIENWDHIDIDLGTINFYDPLDGTPLENTTTKYNIDEIVDTIRARVINISYDRENCLMTITAQFNKKMRVE